MANANGVDVSHWQTLADWSVTGLSFVIAKASEGTTKDAMYDRHIAKGRAAGLVVGAYAFNRADVSMDAQVDAFIAAAGDADLYVLDVEEEGVAGTQKFTLTQTKAFITRFRALTGKPIGLYMSESGFYSAGQDFDWVAHWGVLAPTRPWDFHQYRGSPLDLDQYDGTDAALRSFVRSLNGGNMPTLSAYLPGYNAIVGVGARIRVEPNLTATTIRTTTKAEPWVITGWAVGEVYAGSAKWLCRWFGGRWEYTHEVNVTAGPDAPVNEVSCKPYSDSAYADGYTQGHIAGYEDGYAMGHIAGYADGYAVGDSDGYGSGYSAGVVDGKKLGYAEGLAAGEATGTKQEQERIKGVLGLE